MPTVLIVAGSEKPLIPSGVVNACGSAYTTATARLPEDSEFESKKPGVFDAGGAAGSDDAELVGVSASGREIKMAYHADRTAKFT